MKYADGHDADVGDVIGISVDLMGTVVVLIEAGVAIEGFAPEEWSYLKEGILVQTKSAGLTHYPEAYNASLGLASRA